MKFTISGEQGDFQEIVKQQAELMVLRAALTGNAHQPVDVQQVLQNAVRGQAVAYPPALPPASPPPTRLLPSSDVPSAGHGNQQIVHAQELPPDTPPAQTMRHVRRFISRALWIPGAIAVILIPIAVFDLLSQGDLVGTPSPPTETSPGLFNGLLTPERSPEDVEQEPDPNAPPSNAGAKEPLPVPDGLPEVTGHVAPDDDPDAVRRINEMMQQLIDQPAVNVE